MPAPPGARSAAMAERTACSAASTSAILAWSPGSVAASRSAYSVWARSSDRRWMSYHRARASLVLRSPCASATPIASCRAAPLAYASMILDCQLAVAAERRRPDWTIHVIRPARISTPSRIHSQSRFVPEPEAAVPGDVADVGAAAVAVAVAVAVTVAVDGTAVGVVAVSVGVGVGVGVEPAVA